MASASPSPQQVGLENQSPNATAPLSLDSPHAGGHLSNGSGRGSPPDLNQRHQQLHHEHQAKRDHSLTNPTNTATVSVIANISHAAAFNTFGILDASTLSSLEQQVKNGKIVEFFLGNRSGLYFCAFLVLFIPVLDNTGDFERSW